MIQLYSMWYEYLDENGKETCILQQVGGIITVWIKYPTDTYHSKEFKYRQTVQICISWLLDVAHGKRVLAKNAYKNKYASSLRVPDPKNVTEQHEM